MNSPYPKLNIKIFILLLMVCSFNINAQSCKELDSLISFKVKYFFGDINISHLKNSKLILPNKIGVFDVRQFAKSAVNLLNLSYENRVYKISECLFKRENNKIIFTLLVEEYRKYKNKGVYEGYEFTTCSCIYKCINRAYFIFEKKNNKAVFLKWEYD